MGLAIATDPDVPGLTRVARSPDWPRPHVVILGGIHGNEPCGVEAMDKILADAELGRLPLLEGTLLAIHGNPEASRVGVRSTLGGADLNRLFDFAFESELPRHRYSYEHHRALALRPVLEDADAALDIHSATAPTAPFAISPDRGASLALGARLGLGFLTVGWEGPGLLGEKVALSVLTRRARPAVAVECGSHDDVDAVDVAYRTMLRFLEVTGLLAARQGEPTRPTLMRIRDAIKRPSAHFAFDRPIAGLERLTEGRLLGGDRNIEIRVRAECRAVMPNDRVSVGQDMIYVAIEEDWPSD